MSNERKEQGTTRQHILQLLRRSGQMTALELSDALNIGAVGVRQHLALLERDGLVAVAGLRRNVGRPSHLYALTAHAESYFPKSYDTIALEVIDHLAEIGGEEAVTEAFRRRRKRLATHYASRLNGKTRVQQVAALTEMLLEQGYMCEYEQLEDGSFLLTEHNCPVDCVARQHPQLCEQEIQLYEDVLGVPLIRDTTIAKGGLCCSYRIPA
jgi:predicted ArsR family transcriptional regulator